MKCGIVMFYDTNKHAVKLEDSWKGGRGGYSDWQCGESMMRLDTTKWIKVLSPNPSTSNILWAINENSWMLLIDECMCKSVEWTHFDDSDERNCLLRNKMFDCSFHGPVFIPRNFYEFNLQVYLNTFDFPFGTKEKAELEIEWALCFSTWL